MAFLNNGLIYPMITNAATNWENWQYYIALAACILAVIAVSYLLGSINSAIIISKLMYRDDVRKHGSGNAGLTNMLRTYGKGAAALVLVGDMLKSVFAVLFAALIFGFGYEHAICTSEFCYVAGLFAVLGHIFPVYYQFKGGKGVLSTATVALVLTPIPFAVLLLVFIGIVAMSKYVSLGSVSVAVLYPVLVNGYINFLGAYNPPLVAISTIILAILIVWCHRENLKRIGERTERKLSFKKKDVEVKKEENNDE